MRAGESQKASDDQYFKDPANRRRAARWSTLPRIGTLTWRKGLDYITARRALPDTVRTRWRW